MSGLLSGFEAAPAGAWKSAGGPSNCPESSQPALDLSLQGLLFSVFMFSVPWREVSASPGLWRQKGKSSRDLARNRLDPEGRFWLTGLLGLGPC